MNILNAVGRSDLFMKLDFSKIPLLIITMMITIPISVKAIVIGSFINSFICYFINAYLPGKLFNFGVKAQFNIFWKIMVVTALMALVTFLSMNLFTAPILKLIFGFIIGSVSYFVLAYLIKIPELEEIVDIIKIRLKLR